MTTISPLKTILKKGLFGDHEGKNEAKLIEIKEGAKPSIPLEKIVDSAKVNEYGNTNEKHVALMI